MPSVRAITRITDADDAVGGKVPVAVGGTGSPTAAGAALNLGVHPISAAKGSPWGGVRVDPAGREVVHRGLYPGVGSAANALNPGSHNHRNRNVR